MSKLKKRLILFLILLMTVISVVLMKNVISDAASLINIEEDYVLIDEVGEWIPLSKEEEVCSNVDSRRCRWNFDMG